MAFKHRISFATDLAANFGCYRFRIIPDIVSKHLRAAIWSRCAVLFEFEQTPFPQTGSISFATDWAANFGCDWFRITPDIVSKLVSAVIWSRCAIQFEFEQTPFLRTGRRLRPAALHRIRFGTCGFDVIFLLRDLWLIERLSEAMGAALVGNTFSPIPSKISFHVKKKWLVPARNLQSIKTLLTVKPSRYRKTRQEWYHVFLKRACRGQQRLPPTRKRPVYARPSDRPKQSWRAAPRAWPLILPSKSSITFWNRHRRDCQMTCRGSNLDANLNSGSATWPTSCKGFTTFLERSSPGTMFLSRNIFSSSSSGTENVLLGV